MTIHSCVHHVIHTSSIESAAWIGLDFHFNSIHFNSTRGCVVATTERRAGGPCVRARVRRLVNTVYGIANESNDASCVERDGRVFHFIVEFIPISDPNGVLNVNF